ncbi:hypothetical protein ACODG7_09345 [Vibrio anguillarum]|uniref:hypothetical protein n=1 Tax=Vibrio TaxID=662 RepID=UPI0002F55D7D|nr:MULTISPECIES: hypothetical protein [Vibrio]MDE1326326.1 hypothetical protein [Vibrio aestuarianus]MDQ2163318.1 hypothetical protein [Vibrio anguillarum]NNN94722.1 hypothetical protein [Vibrio sp. B4-6]OEE35164.1 hypothetical protein A1QW_08225 [Vibrio anguillarum]
MEKLITFLAQNPTLTILAVVVALFILKRTSTKILSSNRGVSVGRDINAPIMTGDINSNQTSVLGLLANIATIIALLVSIATLYISYLALA